MKQAARFFLYSRNSRNSRLKICVTNFNRSKQPGLLLLEIDESKLESEVRFEKSTNDELFPHVYGPINKRAILSVTQLREE